MSEQKQVAQVTLHQERTTKGTVVYQHPHKDSDPIIPTLYLRKSGMSMPYPETIVVTVEAV